MNVFFEDTAALTLLVTRGADFAFLEAFVSDSEMDVEEINIQNLSGYKFFINQELNTTITYLNVHDVLFTLTFPIEE